MKITQAVKTTDSSDSELVTRSLAGNRDAFGGIVARYGHRCWGVSREIYGHWEESWNTNSSKIRTDVFYLLHDPKG